MMKRTLLYLAAGLAPLFSPLSAHADDCERFFQKWGQALHPGREIMTAETPSGPHSYPYGHAVCKIWPANEALTLAVLPFPQAGSNDDEATFDLEVLVADTASGRIIAHTFEKSAIYSDAVHFDDLSLDTARYQLAPDKRAFGVRVMYKNSSRPNPYEEATLSLYVLDGRRVRKVLDRLTVEHSSGEWDTICTGDFNTTTRTLGVGPRGKNGYAVLKITEKTIYSTSTAKGEQCISKETHDKHSITIGYLNGRYTIPKQMQFIN